MATQVCPCLFSRMRMSEITSTSPSWSDSSTVASARRFGFVEVSIDFTFIFKFYCLSVGISELRTRKLYASAERTAEELLLRNNIKIERGLKYVVKPSWLSKC